MEHSNALSGLAQATYSQLLDLLTSAELRRAPHSVHGSFSVKQVGGKRFWYFSLRIDPQKVRQIYIGPDVEAVRKLVEQHQQKPADSALVLQSLSKLLIANGGQTIGNPFLLMLRRLADAGAFRAGAVVVGTHAFNAYSGMLGVRWLDSFKTNDVDIAHGGRSMALALRHDDAADLHGALTIDNGFLPAILESGVAGVTYRSQRDATFEIDFVTPETSVVGPVTIPSLNVVAQPIKFIQFLLQDVQRAVVLSDAGSSQLVTVPAPARYAAHKLIVAANRPVAERAKSKKDLKQFLALAEVLPEDEINEALAAAASEGPGWRSRLARSLKLVGESHRMS